MATNQEDKNASNTPFPNPPVYWQSFTPDNLEAYDDLQRGAGNGPEGHLPEDLKNLRPPTPPANGDYRIFGEHRALTAPQRALPEETPLLVPGTGVESSPQHLLNLTRSLMLSYLELLHIMAINPEPPIYGVKWEDLRDLFKNAHHGLNMYRSWQAKDSLIKLLEQTRDNARAETQGVQSLKTKVDLILRDVAHSCQQVTIGVEDRLDKDVEMGDGVETNGRPDKAVNGTSHVHTDRESRLWNSVNQETDV